MAKKVKVAAVEIDYPDGESKKISVDDARALYEQLHELFGDKAVQVSPAPIIIERDRYPRWRDDFWQETTDVRPKFVCDAPQVWCCS